MAWCACEAAHVAIDAAPGPATIGLAVLRIDAAALGGPLARSWVEFTPGAWGDGGRECADATLDHWIEGHPPSGTDSEGTQAGWLDADPSRAGLRRAAFRVIASVEPSHPFGIVAAPAGDCAIAVSKSGETLSLRAAGGEWLVSHAHGALAWCTSTAETRTVWRDGTGPVAVIAAPGARLGGLLGARECADAAGVIVAADATWLRGEDLPWEAAAVLRASSASDVTSAPLRVEPGAPDARLVALALSLGASAVSEPEGVVLACDPPLAAGSRDSVCAHSAPVSWFNKKDAPAGAARASLPFWLSTLEGHRELDAVARIPELLTLARRLTREGFEPTTLEGITELPSGVRITGRAGEDAVVAVGLASRPPWAFPYSDAVPWDLGDAPRVVSLRPGESVTLTSSPPPTAPLNTRRTVVFRHALTP